MAGIFELAPQEQQDIYNRAAATPLALDSGGPDLIGADTFWAPAQGVEQGVAGLSMFVDDALAPTLKSVVGQPLDKLLGTHLSEDIDAIDQASHKAYQATLPDPNTTSVASQIVSSVVSQLALFAGGTAIGGPLAGAAVTGSVAGNEAMQQAKDQGVDPGTAMELGAVQGGATAAGAFLPMHFSPELTAGLSRAGQVLADLGFGAASQTAFGVANRAATSTILSSAGYGQMAQQYQAFDRAAMLQDAIAGAGFSGIAHALERGTGQTSPAAAGDALPQDVQNALEVTLNAKHLELDTAPGIPATPEARQAHVAAIQTAVEQLLAGEPVDVGERVAAALEGDRFVPREGIDAGAAEAKVAADDFLGPDFRLLADDLAARGMPSHEAFDGAGADDGGTQLVEAALRTSAPREVAADPVFSGAAPEDVADRGSSVGEAVDHARGASAAPDAGSGAAAPGSTAPLERGDRTAAASQVDHILRENPSAEFIDENGQTVAAHAALTEADQGIAAAEQDGPGYDAAADCAARG